MSYHRNLKNLVPASTSGKVANQMDPLSPESLNIKSSLSKLNGRTISPLGKACASVKISKNPSLDGKYKSGSLLNSSRETSKMITRSMSKKSSQCPVPSITRFDSFPVSESGPLASSSPIPIVGNPTVVPPCSPPAVPHVLSFGSPNRFAPLLDLEEPATLNNTAETISDQIFSIPLLCDSLEPSSLPHISSSLVPDIPVCLLAKSTPEKISLASKSPVLISALASPVGQESSHTEPSPLDLSLLTEQLPISEHLSLVPTISPVEIQSVAIPSVSLMDQTFLLTPLATTVQLSEVPSILPRQASGRGGSGRSWGGRRNNSNNNNSSN